MIGNDHARFWIGGGGSNPFADHSGVLLSANNFLQGMLSICVKHPLGRFHMALMGEGKARLWERERVIAALAVVAGLIADLLVWRLKPSLAIPVAFRVFAFVVPLVYYALYFLVLLVTKGVGWSMNLWMGSIVMAGIVGLLVSYLLVPPLTHEIM